MVIDLAKCTACQACTTACRSENNLPEGIFWHHVIPLVNGKYPNIKAELIPRPCMHCENAPCVQVCPVKATYKREDGLVLIDYDKCIGCKYCLIACPYGARYSSDRKPFLKTSSNGHYANKSPYYNPEVRIPPKGVVEKCTFCLHRIGKGNFTPACVEACPAVARYFGDLDDPNSQVSKLISTGPSFRLREELGTKPQVYYLARR